MERLLLLARQLNGLERLALAAVAVSPIVLGALMLAAVVDRSPVWLVVWLAFGLLVAGLGAVSIARRLRARREAVGQPRAVTPPGGLQKRTLLADEPEPWADLDSPGLDRRRVVRRSAGFSRSVLQLFGTQSKSPWIREVFAYVLTEGRLDYAAIADLFDSKSSARSRRLLLPAPDLNLLLVLRRVVASQMLSDRDARVALAMIKFVADRITGSRMSQPNRLMVASQLIISGQLDAAASIVSGFTPGGFTEQLLAADVLNPFQPNPLEDGEQQWLGAFNAMYRKHGFEPVALTASGPTPYDRLEGAVSDRAFGGPMVSIIMSCYRPDSAILTAVRSVVQQTWQNWELLVVDDCSPPDFDGILDEVAAMDPRVRVIRSTDNAGTYVRRNDALELSRGELVTMHDSDDWAHPRRIEVQVRHLVANPETIANLAQSLRVTESLLFSQPRGPSLRLAESSLLFRKAPVLERIGYFDNVRKSADSEFRRRLEVAFGQTVPIVDTICPPILVRYTASSLSGSDLGDGWMHLSRVAYRQAWSYWHQQIATGIAGPRVTHPLQERPFPAPDRLYGLTVQRYELDVLAVVDGLTAANQAERAEEIASELETFARDGKTVGVLVLPVLSDARDFTTIAAPMQALVNDGTVRRVLLEEAAHATHVIVRNAAVLQAITGEESGLTADWVVVIDETVAGIDRRGTNFARLDVDENAKRIFGHAPLWLPAEAALRHELTNRLPPSVAPGSVAVTEEAERSALAELERLAAPRARLGQPTGYAATAVSVLELVRIARSLPDGAVIVEAGSGFSTVWLALAIAHEGKRVSIIALEHDRRYADETRAMLDEQGVGAVAEVRLAPLVRQVIDGTDCQWYADEAWRDIVRVDVLFVDGPPKSSGPFARYPAVPALRHALVDGALVVLDDTHRDEERVALGRWLTSTGAGGELAFERALGRSTVLRNRLDQR